MKTKDLIAEINLLPLEKRVMVVDSLLHSINPPDTETDKEWVEVAKKRLSELRTGTIKPVPGEDVFDKIRKKYAE